MSELKKEWYVVNTYAGHENKVKENLIRRVETMNLQECLFQIVVAEEKEIEYKNGKEVEKVHNIFPGYLFVEMIMTDEAWYVVRNTSGVTGFIGSSGGGTKPFPIAKHEIEPILKSMGVKTEIEVDFEEGDEVNIFNGPFAGKIGKVEYIDREKETARVLVEMLGGVRPITVDVAHLQKVEY